MRPARRGRTRALIGRLLITGFDTRLASGSSVARAGCGAGLFGIRIGCGRARRCVICTRTGSWVRTRGPRAPRFPPNAAACTGVRVREQRSCPVSSRRAGQREATGPARQQTSGSSGRDESCTYFGGFSRTRLNSNLIV
jgi:hypothetical protein